AGGDWILSLDGDESVDDELCASIRFVILGEARSSITNPIDVCRIPFIDTNLRGFWVRRKNHFLGRWIKHGGFWPDPKLRLFRRGEASFEERAVHETVQVKGTIRRLTTGALVHHSYPTLCDYIDHMNRYSSLGAEMAGGRGFSFANIVVRPVATFVYNYFFRLGFLDGREGLLLHLYHSVYVSWKYAKAWELARADSSRTEVRSE